MTQKTAAMITPEDGGRAMVEREPLYVSTASGCGSFHDW
jgi:hypothetical protein